MKGLGLQTRKDSEETTASETGGYYAQLVFETYMGVAQASAAQLLYFLPTRIGNTHGFFLFIFRYSVVVRFYEREDIEICTQLAVEGRPVQIRLIREGIHEPLSHVEHIRPFKRKGVEIAFAMLTIEI